MIEPMKLQQATQIAKKLIYIMSPTCYKIRIAGSIRRGKPEVKDIEIVAAPKPAHNLFGEKDWAMESHLDFALRQMEENNGLELIKGGKKYRQYQLPQGIKLDLFLVTPPAQWGIIYLLRTGPAEFSKWMVAQRNLGGALPSNAYVKDGVLRINGRWLYDETIDDYGWQGGEIKPVPEEADYFALCGLDYMEPAERRPAWRR